MKLFLLFKPNLLFINMEFNPLFPVIMGLMTISSIRVSFLERRLSFIKWLASRRNWDSSIFSHDRDGVVYALNSLVKVFIELEWLWNWVFTQAQVIVFWFETFAHRMRSGHVIMFTVIELSSIAHQLWPIFILFFPPCPLYFSPFLLFILKLLPDISGDISTLTSFLLIKFLRSIALNDFLVLVNALWLQLIFIKLIEWDVICVLHGLVHLFLVRSFNFNISLPRQFPNWLLCSRLLLLRWVDGLI